VRGAEERGVRDATLAAADLRLRIPMAQGIDSLNVVTACAVALDRLGGGPQRIEEDVWRSPVAPDEPTLGQATGRVARERAHR
jgi:SpoU rRNA Methylase family